LAISEDSLESQLRWFRQQGFVGLTFAECEHRRAAGNLPQRSLVITFDDGYASVLRAKPILDEFGFPATVFIVKSFMETGEPRWTGIAAWLDSVLASEHAAEMRPLDWNALELLVESGWEVGSHTLSHPHLPSLPDPELARELELSRDWIAQRLGCCETIAYPYGRADERVSAAARKAGYLCACTLTGAHTADERYRRPRVELRDRDVGLHLAIRVSPISLSLRRSRLAKLAHRIPRRRTWLPKV
jgi:peptidoglycan/xylan/chitin deacetylase (PgdA/CDA1 family)